MRYTGCFPQHDALCLCVCVCVCVQAAQQGDSTKVDKRRKKKQKEQAEDEAFLDNGQDDDAEYQQGGSGKPLPPLHLTSLLHR